MLFFDCSTAPSPRRVRIFMAEKSIPYETVEVNLGLREQFNTEFKALNPSCTVPALKLPSGDLLTDSSGIVRYLESTFENTPLLGRSALEQGRVSELVSKVDLNGYMAVAEAFRNRSKAMIDRALPGPNNFAQIPALAERGLERIDLFFEWLDGAIGDSDFLIDGYFSYADISACIVVDFARIVKKVPSEELTNLNRWRESLHRRPSFSL